MDLHLPPEERVRLRAALVGFAAELLAGSDVSVEEAEGQVEDTAEQRDALLRWRGREAGDLAGALEAAFDAVLCGALWESPVFRPAGGAVELRFHRGWRVIVDGASDRVSSLADRHGLLIRDR